MEKLSREAKIAVFNERVRLVDELDKLTDGILCSDDLLNFKTFLNDDLLELGEELGLVSVQVINSETAARDRLDLYQRLKGAFR